MSKSKKTLLTGICGLRIDVDIVDKCKKTTFIKTVIGDVVAHLNPQKFNVLSDF